jgi:hypothetical protein
MHQQGSFMERREIIMSTLLNNTSSAYVLNSKANQIAQSQPEVARALRMRAAYGSQQPFAQRVAKIEAKAVKSAQALNSKANSIAQSQPQRAIQLRMQAAFA